MGGVCACVGALVCSSERHVNCVPPHPSLCVPPSLFWLGKGTAASLPAQSHSLTLSLGFCLSLSFCLFLSVSFSLSLSISVFLAVLLSLFCLCVSSSLWLNLSFSNFAVVLMNSCVVWKVYVLPFFLRSKMKHYTPKYYSQCRKAVRNQCRRYLSSVHLRNVTDGYSMGST